MVKKNNIKKFTSRLFILGMGIGLAIGFNYVFAIVSYSGPTADFPLENAPTPLNVSSTDQVKDAGLSVNAFIANGLSTFNNDVTLANLSDPISLKYGISDFERPLCINNAGKIITCSSTSGPIVDFVSNSGHYSFNIASYEPVILSWSSSGASICSTSFTPDYSPYPVAGNTSGYYTLSSPSFMMPGAYTYRVTCSTTEGYSTTKSLTITMIDTQGH